MLVYRIFVNIFERQKRFSAFDVFRKPENPFCRCLSLYKLCADIDRRNRPFGLNRRNRPPGLIWSEPQEPSPWSDPTHPMLTFRRNMSDGFYGIRIVIANIIKSFPPFSPDPVYMPFKITIAQQLGKDKLLKYRYRTGIEAKPALKVLQQFFGQNHVTDAHGWGNGF